MKIFVGIIILIILSSCLPQKEVKREVKEEVKKVESVPEKQKKQESTTSVPSYSEPKPLPVEPSRIYRDTIKCNEMTSVFFNAMGIEVLPFLRVAFYDIDGEGKDEMITGSKEGMIRLYKKSRNNLNTKWVLDQSYFSGLRANAFSAPAIGDIDNDGKPELIIGTGGFSPESGRIVLYRNIGTTEKPIWEKIQHPVIDVGDDAVPTLYDIDGDGKLDLVVGNSSGNLVLYRNKTKHNNVLFKKDDTYFKGIDIGMYAVPAVYFAKDKVIIIAGNSEGKLYLLERKNSNTSWHKEIMNLSFNNFASPSFINSEDHSKRDMVVADGYGQLYYFKSRGGNYRDWEMSQSFFNERIISGSACAPSITLNDNLAVMVVGNINGELKLFEFRQSAIGLPWVERPDFFKGIRLSSFSRGILTDWKGELMLITGQHDGVIRAFVNKGTYEKPTWIEKKGFFDGIPMMMHVAPAVFDLDGDGNWELITGDVEGKVRGFKYYLSRDGKIQWREIEESFREVIVNRFSSPAIVRYGEKLYLFVGQQDGSITMFTAIVVQDALPIFKKTGDIGNLDLKNHSVPAVFSNKGYIELSIGDYDGNLKHFACRFEKVEVRED